MKRSFWAFLFSVFVITVSGSAFADTPGAGTAGAGAGANAGATGGTQGGGSGGGSGGGQQQAPTHVTLTIEEYEKLRGGKKEEPTSGGTPPDLNDRVARERADREKADNAQRAVEEAVQFNLGLDKLVADNKDLLPKDVADIVRVSMAEKYDTAAAQAAAVKAAIIKSYFSLEDNCGLLTFNQKAELDNYNKLTKTAKEERANYIYSNIFEPTLKSQQLVKKAEELNRGRSGGVTPGGAQAEFRDKMIKASTEKYLRK